MTATIDLSGKHALVTGGSRGIGRAIAVALAHSGASVVVNYHRNETAAEQTVTEIEGQGGKAWAIQADVALKDEVDRMFSEAHNHFGDRLDVLVNNAGDRWMAIRWLPYRKKRGTVAWASTSRAFFSVRRRPGRCSRTTADV